MPAEKNKLVVILGPTSAGKTGLAVKLAKEFNGEIISADSRQVYKDMDIGTGKDLAEYGRLPYHLIDVASPKSQFSLAKYQKLAYKAIDNIIKRGKIPFLVGGTGLYLQSIIDGYVLNKNKPDLKLRKKLSNKTIKQLQYQIKKLNIKLNDSDFNNKRRLIRIIEKSKPNKQLKKPKYDCLQMGLTFKKEKLDKRIDQRLLHRLEKENMVGEVKKLHKNGVSWKRLDEFGLEYRFIAKYLQKKLTYNEMVEKLETASHQFAKKQMTWFKRDKRINWIKNYSQAKKLITQFYL